MIGYGTAAYVSIRRHHYSLNYYGKRSVVNKLNLHTFTYG